MPCFPTNWLLCSLASANMDCTLLKNKPNQKVSKIRVLLSTERGSN